MPSLAIAWSPGIGDASPMGWTTVAAYALAGILCALVGLRPGSERRRRGWACIALGALILGISKRWDLLSVFAAIGRDVVSGQVWLEHRFAIQGAAMAVVVIVGLLVLRRLLLDTACRTAKLGLLAVAGLAIFATTRAISLHHFEMVLGLEVLGAQMNWVIELGGIAVLGLAAGRAAVA